MGKNIIDSVELVITEPTSIKIESMQSKNKNSLFILFLL